MTHTYPLRRSSATAPPRSFHRMLGLRLPRCIRGLALITSETATAKSQHHDAIASLEQVAQ
jgi:hypothetical protein